MRRATTVFAALVLTGAAAAGCGGRQDAPSADTGGEITCEVDIRHPDRHRDRQRDRRLLLARQRLRRADLDRHRRQGQGHRRRDRRLGAEHPAARRGNVSGGVLAGRHRRRRGEGHGQLRREKQPVQAISPHPHQLHPGDRPQGRRHRLVADMQGKRVSTGSPKFGHRGHRQPAAGIGRPEPGQPTSPRSGWTSPRPSTA